ncbi:MAG: RDD family protein [Blastocatellia bacterium]|nr:RDD family protein [Blastocatellia bacterium]
MPYNAIVTAQAVPANLPAYRQGLDELVIETPERVELYYTRAQVGNRFLAAFIDHLIQLFILAGLALAAYSAQDALDWIWSGLGDWLLAGVILLSFFIYTSYFVIFETIWNGQTPGKRLFRLRVIREDGRPIRFYESLVRNLIRTALDSMPMVIVPLYSIGIVSVFLSGRSKRIGDYVAGTVVIRESETKAPTLSGRHRPRALGIREGPRGDRGRATVRLRSGEARAGGLRGHERLSAAALRFAGRRSLRSRKPDRRVAGLQARRSESADLR